MASAAIPFTNGIAGKKRTGFRLTVSLTLGKIVTFTTEEHVLAPETYN